MRQMTQQFFVSTLILMGSSLFLLACTSQVNHSADSQVAQSSVMAHSYALESATPFSCEQVVVLTQPDPYTPLVVPARDSTNTCYVLKIASNSYFPTSSVNTVTDAEVVSRNHDNGNGNSYDTHHPYVLSANLLRVYLNDERSVKLAGAADANANILVDNFLLVGIYPSFGTENLNGFYKAYGTNDSTVNGTNNVIFRGHAVPLAPFGDWGTSTIAPLSFTGIMTTNTDMTLDVRALDCGGVGASSDLYLLFQ